MRGRLDLRAALALAALLLAVRSGADPAASEVPLWLETTPAARPPLGGNTIFPAYDAVAQRVVILLDGDLWSFDGTAWTILPSGGPGTPVGSAGALAFDRSRGVLVADLGIDGVWERRQGVWNQAAGLSPGVRSLVFHDRLATLVGVRAPDLAALEVYAYKDGVWTLLPGTSPPVGLQNFGVTYDAARDRLVLFGGSITRGLEPPVPSDETFEWDGTTWRNPQPVIRPTARAARLAYDSARRRTVLFGGTGYRPPNQPLGDTWEWDGAAWGTRFPASAPEPRQDTPIVYDEHRRRVVLIGHGVSQGTANDTWEYSSYAGSCASNDQCDTATCDQGICCHDACGPCQRCDPSGVGCLPVQGVDDADSCTGPFTCDAAGRCKKKGGQTCRQPSECAAGECTSGICCTAHCAPYACEGTGACKVRCSADADCVGEARCQDGACVAPLATCSTPVRLRSSQGTEQDCAPFACDAIRGACRVACTSSDECAEGFLCSGGQTCRSAPPATSAGCTVGARGRDLDRGAGGAGVLAAWLVVVAVKRRRRERDPS